MFREEVTRSVERIGSAAVGALWPLFRPQVQGAMARMSDAQLRGVLRAIHEEAARLRERFP